MKCPISRNKNMRKEKLHDDEIYFILYLYALLHLIWPAAITLHDVVPLFLQRYNLMMIINAVLIFITCG